MKVQNILMIIFSANAVVAIIYLLFIANNNAPFSSPFMLLVSVSLLLSSVFGMHTIKKKNENNNG